MTPVIQCEEKMHILSNDSELCK